MSQFVENDTGEKTDKKKEPPENSSHPRMIPAFIGKKYQENDKREMDFQAYPVNAK
jgi:hypothetical protein